MNDPEAREGDAEEIILESSESGGEVHVEIAEPIDITREGVETVQSVQLLLTEDDRYIRKRIMGLASAGDFTLQEAAQNLKGKCGKAKVQRLINGLVKEGYLQSLGKTGWNLYFRRTQKPYPKDSAVVNPPASDDKHEVPSILENEAPKWFLKAHPTTKALYRDIIALAQERRSVSISEVASQFNADALRLRRIFINLEEGSYLSFVGMGGKNGQSKVYVPTGKGLPR